HLPPAGAKGEGGLALARRGQGEDLPADGSDDGHDHDPDYESGDEDRSIEGWARHLEERDECQVPGEPRAEADDIRLQLEDRPQTEDDAGDGGGQVDEGDERAPAPAGGV